VVGFYGGENGQEGQKVLEGRSARINAGWNKLNGTSKGALRFRRELVWV